MDEISIHIEADVNPTETEDKVKRAVENLFGNVPMQMKPLRKGSLLFVTVQGQENLTKFHNLLSRERIRSAARTIFLQGLEKGAISFCLNKQVAFAGHISFSQETGESPLGPIKVRIECSNTRRIIEWLTSRT
jgi:predicted RNA binding protein with dsRBD fold (UPF0201 family)